MKTTTTKTKSVLTKSQIEKLKKQKPVKRKMTQYELASSMLTQIVWGEGLTKKLNKGHWMVAMAGYMMNEVFERGDSKGNITIGYESPDDGKVNVSFTAKEMGLEVNFKKVK